MPQQRSSWWISWASWLQLLLAAAGQLLLVLLVARALQLVAYCLWHGCSLHWQQLAPGMMALLQAQAARQRQQAPAHLPLLPLLPLAAAMSS